MIKIGLCQINPIVGNVDFNFSKIVDFLEKSDQQHADLYVFPEFSLTGYPLSDLCVNEAFLGQVAQAVERLCDYSQRKGVAMLIGTPWRLDGKLYNAALYIENGAIRQVICKKCLPNYGVFDEKRYFSHDRNDRMIEVRGHKIAVLICEDIWGEEPTCEAINQHADIIVCINGSPYEVDKLAKRFEIVRSKVNASRMPVLYLNLIGGQDDLVFDGASFVMEPDKEDIYVMEAFKEGYGHVVLENRHVTQTNLVVHEDSTYDALGSVYKALVLSLRDYVQKNHFKGVVLGISGGVDSAISAAIAVDALGAQNVLGVMMPYHYTSQESISDSAELSKALSFQCDTSAIHQVYGSFMQAIEKVTGETAPNLMEENLQARIRGCLLMSLSNKTGYMVLSTGNKSEMAVGYATLYGDMCGGFNALKDVYKTQVFKLCHWRNAHWDSSMLGPEGVVIPEQIILKPPSAELRDDQKDSDSLPEYDVLDALLEAYIERDLSPHHQEVHTICADRDVAKKVFNLFTRSEYKRRQAAPGPKITQRALANDRRYPITNAYVS